MMQEITGSRNDMNAASTSKESVRRRTSGVSGSKVSFRSQISDDKPRESVADVIYKSDYGDSIMDSQSVRDFESSGSLRDVSTGCGCLCWRKFTVGLRKIWATRNTEDVMQSLELFAKTTLRELFTYVIFIILLMIIAFGMSTANIYYFTVGVSELFTTESFNEMNNVEEFWKYVEGDFLNGLYWEEYWYNNRTNISKKFIFFESILMSVPQIRQLRIKKDLCKTPELVRSVIPSCFDYYATSNVDKSPFGLENGSAWTYTDNPDMHIYAGVFGTYGKGGNIQPLSKTKDESAEILKTLKENLWIDKGTRVVFLDFTVYNANINLFSVIKLIFELPPTGGVFSFTEIRTVKLIRYVDPFDYFVMACEITYMVFILYYIIEEIIEIKKNKLSYFSSVWNILDIFVIVISCVCAVFNIYRTVYVNTKLDFALQDADSFADFDFISFWHKLFNEAIALTVFFAWVKIFKYISFNKTMTQLTDTIGHSMKDLTGFFIMFFIFFFAFAQCGYLMFGPQVHGFREFDHSVFTLFRVILGDFQFDDLARAHPFWGPVFFIFYVFFVFFILINMFVAIISDSYILVKENIANSKDDFIVSKYIQNQIFSKLKKDKIVKIQEVLEKADIMNKEQFTFQEWRNELQQAGYADVEIQALFLQYDHDHDRMLDYEERSLMLRDIKERKLVLGESPGPQTNSKDDSSSKEEENKEDDEEVDGEAINELVERVNHVEVGIVSIVEKIDLLLDKLGNIEKAKLEQQKTVSASLDFLSGSESSVRY